MTLRAGTPFVVLGDDWGRHVSTLQHIFRHVMTEYPVVWVNSFGHRAPRLSMYDLRRAADKLRRMFGPSGVAERPDGPRVIVDPKALPWHNLAAVRRLNAISIRRGIERALTRVPHSGAPILIAGPTAVDLVGRLPTAASIYYCLDDLGQMPGVSRTMIEPLERALLMKVDAVVATSAALVANKRPSSGRGYYLPQGVNFEHFAERRSMPEDLAALPRPRIGFAGGISSACDFQLIQAVAESISEGSVVLVGPVEEGLNVPSGPNIHLVGKRPYHTLPAYVQGFDVGIIPYVLNDWTRAVDPLKLLEYLAAGIPVVSTGLPEVEKYSDVVAIARDGEAFVQAIHDALQRGHEPALVAERQALARRHSWARRAKELLTIVEEVAAARDDGFADGTGRVS